MEKSYTKILKRSPKGGYIIAKIETVHTHECPAIPARTRWAIGPCKCGGEELLSQHIAAQGSADQFAGIKPF